MIQSTLKPINLIESGQSETETTFDGKVSSACFGLALCVCAVRCGAVRCDIVGGGNFGGELPLCWQASERWFHLQASGSKSHTDTSCLCVCSHKRAEMAKLLTKRVYTSWRLPIDISQESKRGSCRLCGKGGDKSQLFGRAARLKLLLLLLVPVDV